MKIEEIKEFTGIKDAVDMGYSCRLDNEECVELNKFIDAQQSKINQLEADKLEAYKHIIKNSTSFEFDEYGENKGEYCLECSQDPIDHNSDCIVNKANKYIKEVEK